MLFVILVIIIGLVAYLGFLYNEYVNLRSKIKEEWETIVKNISERVTVTKELQEANKELDFNYLELNDIMDKLGSITNKSEFVLEYQKYEEKLKELLVKVDNNQNISIINNLNNTNNKIEYIRNFYNDNVETYNKKIDMFPTNVMAQICKFEKDVTI